MIKYIFNRRGICEWVGRHLYIQNGNDLTTFCGIKYGATIRYV